jgi:hypothetical protein
MVRSEGSIITGIYKYVRGTNLAMSINGEICKSRNRPVNSDKEDIVIKAVGNTPRQKQQCIVNVNIYVPDIVDEGQYDKNGARCDELEEMAASEFEVFRVDSARVYLDTQHTYEVSEAHAHVINNRLLYTVINE